jgi:hypothetical protein
MRWTLIEFAGRTAAAETDEKNARCLFGYICVCGEQVVVHRLQTRRANVLPTKKTVTCSNAHVAMFAAQHFALLDDWFEDRSS